MPPIVIVDTSVLLNVLDVPGFNQHRVDVLERFGEFVEGAANLLLPIGAVFETGNHIAQLGGASPARHPYDDEASVAHGRTQRQRSPHAEPRRLDRRA